MGEDKFVEENSEPAEKKAPVKEAPAVGPEVAEPRKPDLVVLPGGVDYGSLIERFGFSGLETLVSEYRGEIINLRDNYELMPNSFIVPEEYKEKAKREDGKMSAEEEVEEIKRKQELEMKKRNKLRNAWFTKVIYLLGELADDSLVEPDIVKKVMASQRAIIRKEDEEFRRMFNVEGKNPATIDLTSESMVARVYEIKREAAIKFQGEKIELTEKTDSILTLMLKRFDDIIKHLRSREKARREDEEKRIAREKISGHIKAEETKSEPLVSRPEKKSALSRVRDFFS